MTATTAAARYTIRYRFDGDHNALLVQDDTGDAYIVTPAGLALRLSGTHRFPALEPRLKRLGWVQVPAVAPYTLDGLRGLLGPAIAA